MTTPTVQQLIPAPIYLSRDYVYQFIKNKVGVSNDELKQYLTNDLMDDLIRKGEMYIERKLSPLYVTPFQAKDGDFTTLPEETQVILIDAMTSSSLVRIYRQVGANWNNSNYESAIDNEKNNVRQFISDQLNLKKDGVLLYPPLSGLVLQEDGVLYDNILPGPVVVPQGCDLALPYAIRHVNNPRKNLWSRLYPYGNINFNGNDTP